MKCLELMVQLYATLKLPAGEVFDVGVLLEDAGKLHEFVTKGTTNEA